MRRFLAAADGVVAVETALVIGILFTPMLLGLWDVAQLAVAKAKLEEALQDAVTYVAAGNTNNAGITAAAQDSYGTSTGVSTSTVCYCVPTDTTVPTAPTSVACGGSCSSTSQLETFMSVTVSATVTLPIPLPYLTSPTTIQSTGQVRTG